MPRRPLRFKVINNYELREFYEFFLLLRLCCAG